ncbi:uncharacterized protein LOC127853595 isoform X2 [Dreissena polymorpha]|uniref:uncharacterized protein LOC127853595 isoform X2 n=1 Tax=Dreissena polymorpha TaxID=45954 RepID=UPI002265099A|nr:uncharacterized protein LOC127853595 isoform X2 [Dreissena polymorpha]
MRPPLELNRLTILNIVAIVCYCLSMMFHIIAYATHSWASLVLNGVRWEMGLWQGCRQTDDGGWKCTTDVFQDDVFQNGSDWHTGSQIMMTLALVILFFLEFALLGYLCIHRLQKYKSKLLGFVVGLSMSAASLSIVAFCHFLVLIMYGSEVEKVPDSSVKGSFGVIIISFFLEIAIPIILRIDKESENVFILIGLRKRPVPRSRRDTPDTKDTRSVYSVPRRQENVSMHRTINLEDKSQPTRTSATSLTETETFRKFAFHENLTVNASTASLASFDSINVRSAAYVNHSYMTDRSSIESGV